MKAKIWIGKKRKQHDAELKDEENKKIYKQIKAKQIKDKETKVQKARKIKMWISKKIKRKDTELKDE